MAGEDRSGPLSNDPALVAWMAAISNGQTAMQNSINAGFTEIRATMATKASKADVEDLRHQLEKKADKDDLLPITSRLNEHGKDIGSLKDQARDEKSATDALTQSRSRRSTTWRWVVGTVAMAPLAVLSILQIIQIAK